MPVHEYLCSTAASLLCRGEWVIICIFAIYHRNIKTHCNPCKLTPPYLILMLQRIGQSTLKKALDSNQNKTSKLFNNSQSTYNGDTTSTQKVETGRDEKERIQPTLINQKSTQQSTEINLWRRAGSGSLCDLGFNVSLFFICQSELHWKKPSFLSGFWTNFYGVGSFLFLQ